MFWHILKRDLKRKKTMNFIILLFVILAVTFIASSASNLLALIDSLDIYFEQADVGDYLTFERGITEKSAADVARKLDYVDEVKVENLLWCADGVQFNGESITINGIGMLSSIDNRIEKYFDQNNLELTEVPEGFVYIKKAFCDANGISIGDKITVRIESVEQTFTVNGYLKDAAVGGSMLSVLRLLVHHLDYERYLAQENIDGYKGALTFVNTDNTAELVQALGECQLIGDVSKDYLMLAYLMDMVIVGLLIILSVCLIVIALVILRFTIQFTLREEFREIGIMKAIGIPNGRIRSLYLVKYLVISIAGAAIGTALSIPFGKFLLTQASENLIMSAQGSFTLSAVCALLVIGIVMLSCWRSTRIVRTYTPMDAIRSGSTGERYKKKGFLKLSESHMKPVPFMPINDILSGIGQYAIMLLTFTVGMILISIVLNSISTLGSPKLLNLLGLVKCDLMLVDSDRTSTYFTESGREALESDISRIEKILSDNGYDADVFGEVSHKFTVSKGKLSTGSLTLEGIHTTTDMYDFYLEGTPPQNTREVGLSHVIAGRIGAAVGDTVKITSPEGTGYYIVSAIIQTMTNSGEGIQFHQDEHYSFATLAAIMPIQVRFNDHPSRREIDRRMGEISDLLPDYNIETAGAYVERSTGGAGGYLNDTKSLITLVIILINILVAVLMEKSFLTKERGEIAMLKAIGFRNRSIIGWQTLRIALVMLSAALISGIVSTPVSEMTSGAIFRGLGAKTISFDVNILETYVFYPLIITAATIFFVFLSVLSIRKVSSNEINCVE